MLVFSELSIPGYPADDLYLQPNFQNQSIAALEELKLISINNNCAILVGNLAHNPQGQLLNAAYLIANGKIIHIISKINLPNYSVFDDKRYFTSVNTTNIIEFKGYKLGILICEDLWSGDITNHLCKQGAEILIAINASPFTIEKDQQRKTLAQKICNQYQVDLLYVNQIGGQDELIFDGGSFACNAQGNFITQLDYFREDQANISWHNNQMLASKQANSPTHIKAIYQALMLGLRDYVAKNGFTKILLGLSGGIDSAITAAIAVDALGPENVIAVMLPSQYTSSASMLDAQAYAKDLNIELLSLPIEPIAIATRTTLSSINEPTAGSITDQNIQARIRGLLLMAISNQHGYLLLSTGNKSENAVGYATIYGDMCGGYNPLKDVYKTQVYQLSRWRGLPESIIDKAPSAELAFNQTDQDNLPDYNLLDKIEDNLGIAETSNKGYDLQLVSKIFGLLKKSEYKRRQACPGPIISSCSLSKDRRYPLTNHFNNS